MSCRSWRRDNGVNLALCCDSDTDIISSTQRRTDNKNISNRVNGSFHFCCAEQWHCNPLYGFTRMFTVRTALVSCYILLSPVIAVKSYSNVPSCQYRLKATSFAREVESFLDSLDKYHINVWSLATNPWFQTHSN